MDGGSGSDRSAEWLGHARRGCCLGLGSTIMSGVYDCYVTWCMYGLVWSKDCRKALLTTLSIAVIYAVSIGT